MRSMSGELADFRVKTKERLRWILENNHIEVKEAADICGVSKATMRRWLKIDDPTFMGFDEAASLAKHIRKPIGFLYPQSGWELDPSLGYNPLLSLSALEVIFLDSCLQAARALISGKDALIIQQRCHSD